MNKVIIGIDASTSVTGVNIFVVKDEMVHRRLTFHMELAKLFGKDEVFEKAYNVYQTIEQVLQDNNLFGSNIYIFQEAPVKYMSAGSSNHTLVLLHRFAGLLEGILRAKLQPVVYKFIPVSTARKLIGVKASRKDKKQAKRDVLSWVSAKFEYTPTLNRNNNVATWCYDEADAMLIAWYGANMVSEVKE